MNFQRSLVLVAAFSFLTITAAAQTTPDRQYKDMSHPERVVFVAQQARRIALEMSGSHYEFTPEFEREIQAAINKYAARIGNSRNDRAVKTDLRLVLQRGQAVAPVITAAFRARNVSPLIGLYLPFIESEYVNIETPSGMGALGVFQFIPTTGNDYGLSVEELLDVGKSADAAARYITDSIEKFKGDPMKEALAVLAFNRGAHNTARDLKIVVNEQNKRCSICALTAERSKLDISFSSESVFYVPTFFAAAIIGENPQAFGVQMQPLSSN